jgi:predicted  nucleic acid-binding Zn-ribbon protein
LTHQLAKLRQAQAAGELRCKTLERAVADAQQDGIMVAARLKGEMASKREECRQLAELVFQLREELEAARAQLQHSNSQAGEAARATSTSVQQLQAAAAEWRQRAEAGQQALEDEREQHTALQSRVEELRCQAAQLQAELKEERRQCEAATTDLQALQKAVGGRTGAAAADLVEQLRQQLAMERSWRKAVKQWVRGEVQTKKEVERALLNVSSAMRCGPAAAAAGMQQAPLPPRPVTAGQLMQDHAAVHVASSPDGASMRVTVHSPRAASVSVSSTVCHKGSYKSGSTEGHAARKPQQLSWRQHFQATMRAFDERHQKLQQELSGLRREALHLGHGTAGQ